VAALFIWEKLRSSASSNRLTVIVSPRSRFYALAQFGVANVIYKSNPWPIYETKSLEKEEGELPFSLGTLVLGFKF